MTYPVPDPVLRAALAGYTLDRFGIHGVRHWGRVLENGLMLAELTGADARIVTLFAVLHDCRRFYDGTDPEHGHRAALLVGDLREHLPDLDEADIELLQLACAYHTDGEVHDDPTVGTCWDADRLDLGRVGVRPRSRLLCTDAARDPRRIEAATRRAVDDFTPAFVADVWLAAMD